jgi:hypothetical protein
MSGPDVPYGGSAVVRRGAFPPPPLVLCPMKSVEPEVYLVARPELDGEPSDPQNLAEFAGRLRRKL